MQTKDIRNGLKDVLIDEMQQRPETAWPNVTFDAAVLPRLEFSTSSAASSGGTLKGGEVHRETGIANVVVCIELDAEFGEDQALDIADTVVSLFAEGRRISVQGGEVVITDRPSVERGFPDDTSFRVPVTINYVATAA